jgi:hypothetical protein
MRVMAKICGNQCLVEGKLIKVLRIDAEGYDYFDDPFEALRQIRAERTRADLFTFVQRPSETAAKYNFYWEADNFACLTVTSYHQWFSQQIDFKVRNKIRKAAKAGVAARELEFDEVLVRGISNIYNESPVRQGKRFWHYRKEIDEVRRMNATFLDRSIFIGAFLNGALIGFIKMVTSQDRTLAGLMQIVSMMSHRDKAPTNALMAEAVRSCADRGIKHLLYANFSYGKKQEDSLADFKRHNGFKKIELPRYYVPLTALGVAALRLGLHHRSNNWIPEPVARTFRNLRTRWYASKYVAAEISRKEATDGLLH